LFEEARRFQRRRRRGYLMLALVVCAAAVGAVLLDQGGGGGGARSGRVASVGPARMALASKDLPGLGQSPFVAVSEDRLIVSDTANTSFANGRVEGTCAAASVDAVTLRVVSLVRGNCGDPALFGERVLPIVYAPTLRNAPGWGTNPLAMRVATVDPAAPGGYRLGPVVVTFPDGSDSRAETIYGAGSLWVYAPMTGPRFKPGELLRVSETTGQVVERWKMPHIDRALLATDSDGLWVAPSSESGWPVGATRSEKKADESLYRVAVGMRSPTRVFDIGQQGARWLAAEGQTVWVDINNRPSRSPALWRFAGSMATPTVRDAPTPSAAAQCADMGEGPATVLASASGVYCVINPEADSQQVNLLDASGEHNAVVARVSTPMEWESMDDAVTYRGSYYFIDPGFDAVFSPAGGESSGPGRDASPAVLYRIAPG
jgi:hypothetical protein